MRSNALLFLWLLILSFTHRGEVLATEYFELQGQRWRAAGAYRVTLGDAGFVREWMFAPETFAPFGKIRLKDTNIFSLVTTVTKLDKNFSGQQFSGSITPSAVPGLRAGGNYSRNTVNSNWGTFHIIRVKDPQLLVKELNSEDNAELLRHLASDQNARIITGVVIAENSVALSMSTNNASASVAYNPVSAELTFSKSTSKDTSITLSEGSIVAYELSFLCWNSSNNNLSIFTFWEDYPNRKDHSCPCESVNHGRFVVDRRKTTD